MAVSSCINAGNHSWLPKKTCAAMESAGALVEGDATTVKLGNIEERIAKMEHVIQQLAGKLIK
jgi:hypothetical protein